jgi:DNA topoisomerase-1
MRRERLGFNVRRTMGVAQRLYEGVEIRQRGHGRPDHLHAYRFDARVAGCDAEAREYGRRSWARSICPKPNEYKGKKDAQDAHEAIRPTNAWRTRRSRSEVSERRAVPAVQADLAAFVSSQMTPAVFDQTTVEIAAKADKTYDFRVTRIVLKFDGLPEGGGRRSSKRRRSCRRVKKLPKRLPALAMARRWRWRSCCRSRSLPSRRRATTRRRW